MRPKRFLRFGCLPGRKSAHPDVVAVHRYFPGLLHLRELLAAKVLHKLSDCLELAEEQHDAVDDFRRQDVNLLSDRLPEQAAGFPWYERGVGAIVWCLLDPGDDLAEVQVIVDIREA